MEKRTFEIKGDGLHIKCIEEPKNYSKEVAEILFKHIQSLDFENASKEQLDFCIESAKLLIGYML